METDTDRVVLGRRELVEVLRNKLHHQKTSPGNANSVLSYKYTRLITLKEKDRNGFRI